MAATRHNTSCSKVKLNLKEFLQKQKSKDYIQKEKQETKRNTILQKMSAKFSARKNSRGRTFYCFIGNNVWKPCSFGR